MRRLWLLLLLFAWPIAGSTAAEQVYRLAELAPPVASLEVTRTVTLPELAQLGIAEGRNLIVEERVGDAATLPGLARQLVLTKPGAIIAIGPEAIGAAASTVPIVMFGSDPVGRGLATSLGRPGGNVTGIAVLAADLDAKRLGYRTAHDRSKLNLAA
jgi:putative ABC transport system substrate-binding protein